MITIHEIQNALNEISSQIEILNERATKAEDNVKELRSQLGLERIPQPVCGEYEAPKNIASTGGSPRRY